MRASIPRVEGVAGLFLWCCSPRKDLRVVSVFCLGVEEGMRRKHRASASIPAVLSPSKARSNKSGCTPFVLAQSVFSQQSNIVNLSLLCLDTEYDSISLYNMSTGKSFSGVV